jgi:hypothetical protein
MDISTHDTIVPGELRHKLIIISYFSKLKKNSTNLCLIFSKTQSKQQLVTFKPTFEKTNTANL